MTSTPAAVPEAVGRGDAVTYTPAAYWHRLDDEILEPRQTITVERSEASAVRTPREQQPAPNLDWRGVPFPPRTT